MSQDNHDASPSQCPGDPLRCEHGQRLIEHGLDGWSQAQPENSPTRIELSNCTTCLFAFSQELLARHTLAEKCREKAPDGLRLNISAALGRIDLSTISEEDLGFGGLGFGGGEEDYGEAERRERLKNADRAKSNPADAGSDS